MMRMNDGKKFRIPFRVPTAPPGKAHTTKKG